MFTGQFAKATLERCIRSACASLASLLVADGTDILNTDWADRLSVAGMAAIVSVLLAVAGASTGDHNGPSFGPERLSRPDNTPHL